MAVSGLQAKSITGGLKLPDYKAAVLLSFRLVKSKAIREAAHMPVHKNACLRRVELSTQSLAVDDTQWSWCILLAAIITSFHTCIFRCRTWTKLTYRHSGTSLISRLHPMLASRFNNFTMTVTEPSDGSEVYMEFSVRYITGGRCCLAEFLLRGRRLGAISVQDFFADRFTDGLMSCKMQLF